jgi:hypothetical protein
VLARIVARHPMGRIDELLPFAYVSAAEGCGLTTPLTLLSPTSTPIVERITFKKPMNWMLSKNGPSC